jgi:hypothetical protein
MDVSLPEFFERSARRAREKKGREEGAASDRRRRESPEETSGQAATVVDHDARHESADVATAVIRNHFRLFTTVASVATIYSVFERSGYRFA